MIARASVVALVLLTALVLETALFPAFSVLGFRPNLVLAVVVAIALYDGPLAGARVGAVAGLAVDLMVSQPPVGLSVLVMSAVGYAVGVARPYLAPDSVTAPLLLVFAATFVVTGAYGTLTSLLGAERLAGVLLLQASLVVALYTTLLAPLVLAGMSRLTGRYPLQGQIRE